MKSLKELRFEVCPFSPVKQARKNTLMDKIPMVEVTGFVDRLYLNDKLIESVMYTHKEKMGNAELMENGVKCQSLWNRLNRLILDESPRGLLAMSYIDKNGDKKIISGYIFGFLDGANLILTSGIDDEKIFLNCEIDFEKELIKSEGVEYTFKFIDEESLKASL